MGHVEEFVYGEGSGRRVQTKKVVVGSGTGDGSTNFDGKILEVLDVTLQSPASNIADTYTIKVEAIENQTPGGTASTGTLTLDAYECDVTATTPTWSDSTGGGIASDLTYSVTVLTE